MDQQISEQDILNRLRVKKSDTVDSGTILDEKSILERLLLKNKAKTEEIVTPIDAESDPFIKDTPRLSVENDTPDIADFEQEEKSKEKPKEVQSVDPLVRKMEAERDAKLKLLEAETYGSQIGGTNMFGGQPLASNTHIDKLRQDVKNLNEEIEYKKNFKNKSKEKAAEAKLLDFLINDRGAEEIGFNYDKKGKEFGRMPEAYLFFTDPKTQEVALEHMRRGGFFSERNIDGAIKAFTDKYKDNVLAGKEIDIYNRNFGISTEEFILADIEATWKNFMSPSDTTKAKLIKEYVNLQNSLPDELAKPETQDKLVNLITKINGMSAETGSWFDIKSGYRKPPEGIEQDKQEKAWDANVNEKMDQMKGEMTDRQELGALMVKKFAKFRTLEKEFNNATKIPYDLPEARMNRRNDASTWGALTAQETKELGQGRSYHDAKKRNEFIKLEYWNAKAEYEAAARLYYLNEDPKNVKSSNMRRSRFDEFMVGNFPEFKQGIGLNLREKKTAMANIIAETGQMTLDVQDALLPTFADKFYEGLGGVSRIATEFGVLGAYGKMLSIPQFIGGLKTAKEGFSIGKVFLDPKLARTMGWIADAGYQEAMFKVMDSEWGEGAVFGTTMNIQNLGTQALLKSPLGKKLTGFVGSIYKSKIPLGEKLLALNEINKYSWFQGLERRAKDGLFVAKRLPADMVKSSLSLTIANNSIRMKDALVTAAMNDMDVGYQLNKIFGTGEEFRKQVALDLVVNLGFGLAHLPERISGMHSAFKGVVENQIKDIEKRYTHAVYLDMKPEAEAFEKLLQIKIENLKYMTQQGDYLKYVQESLKTYGEALSKRPSVELNAMRNELMAKEKNIQVGRRKKAIEDLGVNKEQIEVIDQILSLRAQIITQERQRNSVRVMKSIEARRFKEGLSKDAPERSEFDETSGERKRNDKKAKEQLQLLEEDPAKLIEEEIIVRQLGFEQFKDSKLKEDPDDLANNMELYERGSGIKELQRKLDLFTPENVAMAKEYQKRVRELNKKEITLDDLRTYDESVKTESFQKNQQIQVKEGDKIVTMFVETDNGGINIQVKNKKGSPKRNVKLIRRSTVLKESEPAKETPDKEANFQEVAQQVASTEESGRSKIIKDLINLKLNNTGDVEEVLISLIDATKAEIRELEINKVSTPENVRKIVELKAKLDKQNLDLKYLKEGKVPEVKEKKKRIKKSPGQRKKLKLTPVDDEKEGKLSKVLMEKRDLLNRMAEQVESDDATSKTPDPNRKKTATQMRKDAKELTEEHIPNQLAAESKEEVDTKKKEEPTEVKPDAEAPKIESEPEPTDKKIEEEPTDLTSAWRSLREKVNEIPLGSESRENTKKKVPPTKLEGEPLGPVKYEDKKNPHKPENAGENAFKAVDKYYDELLGKDNEELIAIISGIDKDFDYGQMIMDKIYNGDIPIDALIDPEKYESFQRLTPEEKDAVRGQTIFFKSLPKEIQERFKGSMEQFKENQFARRNAIINEHFLASKKMILVDKLREQLRIEEDRDELDESETLFDAEDFLTKIVNETYQGYWDGEKRAEAIDKNFRWMYKLISDEGVLHPRQRLTDFVEDPLFRDSLSSEEAYFKYLNTRSSEEGDIGKISKVLVSDKRWTRGMSVSLYTFLSSINPVRYIAFKTIEDSGTGSLAKGFLKLNYNQNEDRITEVFGTFRDFLDNAYEKSKNVLDEDPSTFEFTGESIETLNERVLEARAQHVRDMINTEEGNTNVLIARENYAMALSILTGIDKNIWKYYFDKPLERIWITRMRQGIYAKPAIIKSLIKQFEKQKKGESTASLLHKFFTGLDLEDTMTAEGSERKVDSNLRKLVNVALDKDGLDFHYKKGRGTASAVEPDSYFSQAIKALRGDKYDSDFYKDNEIVKLYRKIGIPQFITKIAKVYSSSTRRDGSRSDVDIPYENLAEKDLMRMMLQMYFDNTFAAVESADFTDKAKELPIYQHLYRIFESKSQLYLLDAPKYDDPIKSYKEAFESLSKEVRESGFYFSPEEIEAQVDIYVEKLRELTEGGNYQYLIQYAQGDDPMMQRDLLKKYKEDSGSEKTEEGNLVIDDIGVGAIKKANIDENLEAIKDNLRKFLHNYAANTIHFDKIFIGDIKERFDPERPHDKQDLEDIRKMIDKRLGSTNSSGMKMLTYEPDKAGDVFAIPWENHVVLEDVFGDIEWLQGDPTRLVDGALFATQEWFNRAENSIGTIFSKKAKYGPLQSIKAIYHDVNKKGSPTITKGNRYSIDELAQIGNPETNMFKIILDMMNEYNAGKAYEDQIHAISFGPSTTKMDSHKQKNKYSGKNGHLQLFNEKNLGNKIPVEGVAKFIERRDMDNLLYQQDLRSDITPKEEKNPVQKKTNTSIFDDYEKILMAKNHVTDQAFDIASKWWDKMINDDEVSRKANNPDTEFRKYILKHIDKMAMPHVVREIEQGVSLDSPFHRKFLLAYVISRVSKDVVVDKINRVALQEVPMMHGTRLRSVRNVSDIHKLGDKELGIEANENLEETTLLPEIDANVYSEIEGTTRRYGKWIKISSSEDELQGIEDTYQDIKKKYPAKSEEDLRAQAEKIFYSKRYSLGLKTRKEAWEEATNYANQFNDLHDMEVGEAGKMPGKLGKLRTWEIEQVSEGPNGEKGNYFYVPGELIDVTRIPGHGIESHPVGRLRKPIGEENSDLRKQNYIILPLELTVSSGSDQDGDKRFAEVLNLEQNQKTKGSNALFNIFASHKDDKYSKIEDQLERKNAALKDRRKSANNISLMIRAQNFSKRSFSQYLHEKLAMNRYRDIIGDYSKNTSAANLPLSIMETYESNRLLADVISNFASINNSYDALRYVGTGFQTPEMQKNKRSNRIKFKIKLADRKNPNKKDFVDFEVNGFSPDPYHILKGHIGVLLNIALDKKNDLYRLGITEHTAYAFSMLLLGDKSLNESLSKEEFSARADKKVEDIVAFMHSPVVQEYVRLRRNSKNLGEKMGTGQIKRRLKANIDLVKEYGDDLARPNGIVDNFINLISAANETMQVYNYLQIGQKIPKSIPEYMEAVQTAGRMYFNDFDYIDVSNFYSDKKNNESISEADFFLSNEAKDRSLSYFIDPARYLDLDNLNPFMKDINHSLKMAAEIFKHEIEFSDVGRLALEKFIKGNGQDENVKSNYRGAKYTSVEDFRKFVRLFNNGLLSISTNSETPYNERLTQLVANIRAYRDSRDDDYRSSINDFYEMLSVQTVDYAPFTKEKIQINPMYQRAKISDDQIYDAQEAFERMDPAIKTMFSDYLIQTYGAVNSNWTGSFIQLLSIPEKQRIGKNFEDLKNRIQSNTISEYEYGKILYYVDKYIGTNPLANTRLPYKFDPYSAEFLFNEYLGEKGKRGYTVTDQFVNRAQAGEQMTLLEAYAKYAEITGDRIKASEEFKNELDRIINEEGELDQLKSNKRREFQQHTKQAIQGFELFRNYYEEYKKRTPKKEWKTYLEFAVEASKDFLDPIEKTEETKGKINKLEGSPIGMDNNFKEFGIEQNGSINRYMFKPDNYMNKDGSGGLKVIIGSMDNIRASFEKMKRLNKILRNKTLSATIEYIESAIKLYDKANEIIPEREESRETAHDLNLKDIKDSKDFKELSGAKKKAWNDLVDRHNQRSDELGFKWDTETALKKAINQTADAIKEEYEGKRNINDHPDITKLLSGKPLGNTDANRRGSGFTTKKKGLNEYVDVPTRGGKIMARVIAKRLGRKFGYKYKGNKKDYESRHLLITDMGDTPSTFDPATGQIILNKKHLTRGISNHEFIHPFYLALTFHDPSLRQKWANDIKQISRDNPDFAFRVESRVKGKPDVDVEQETFAYFLSSMMDLEYKNKNVLQRIKRKLSHLFDYALDVIGVKAERTNFSELKDMSLQDIVKFFNERKRLDLADINYGRIVKHTFLEAESDADAAGLRMLHNYRGSKYSKYALEAARELHRIKQYEDASFHRMKKALGEDGLLIETHKKGTFLLNDKYISEDHGILRTIGEALNDPAFQGEINDKPIRTRTTWEQLSSWITAARKIGEGYSQSDEDIVIKRMALEYGFDDAEFRKFLPKVRNDMNLIEKYKEIVEKINSAFGYEMFLALQKIKTGTTIEETKEGFKQYLHMHMGYAFSEKDNVDASIDKLFAMIGEYMPSDNQSLKEFGTKAQIIMPENGLVDFPAIIVPGKEGKGSTIIKFILPRGTYYDPKTGKPYEIKDNKGNIISTPLTDSYGHNYGLIFENMVKNQSNKLKLEAAATAKVYEHSVGKTVKTEKVIFIPIQLNLNHDRIVHEERSDSDPVYKREVIKDFDVVPEQVFVIDDWLDHIGEKFMTEMKHISDPLNKEHAKKSLLEQDMNEWSFMIGDMSKLAVERARLFIAETIGKAPYDIKLEDIEDKAPYLNRNIATKFLSQGRKLADINKMSFYDIIINDKIENEAYRYLFSDPKNVTEDNLRPLLGNKVSLKKKTEFLKGIMFIHDLMNQKAHKSELMIQLNPDGKTKDINGNIIKPSNLLEADGWNTIEKLIRNENALLLLQHEMNKYDKDAMLPLQKFLDQSLATLTIFKQLAEESQRGYDGPRVATIMLSKILRNDPNLFRDFRANVPWWDINYLINMVRPKAWISTDTRPAQMIVSMINRKQIVTYEKTNQLMKGMKGLSKTKLTEKMIIFDQKMNDHRWITLLEARKKNITLNKEQHDFIEFLNRAFKEIEGFQRFYNPDERKIPVRFNYQRLVDLYAHMNFNIKRAKKVISALEPGPHDYVKVKNPKNGRISDFGQIKYNSDVDWLKLAIREKDMVVPEIDHLIQMKREADSKLKYKEDETGVKSKRGTQHDEREMRINENKQVLLAARDKNGNLDSKYLFNATFDFIKEKMLQKQMSEVVPLYHVFADQYRQVRNERKSAESDVEISKMNVEKYLEMIVKHDVYRESMDILRGAPMLKNAIDQSIRVAAWWGIAMDANNQIYNFKQGQTQNFINEPLLILSGLKNRFYTQPKEYIEKGESLEILKGIPFLKIWGIEKNLKIGTIRESIIGNTADLVFSLPEKAGYSLVTATERVNQGVLMHGYLSNLRPGRNIYDAYDNNGKVKNTPEAKELALKEWEMEQLKNLVEGVHGYYGFSRGPYSYQALGRAVAMFRLPWMTAQLNNMFGKYKIDATQMEKVGYLYGAKKEIGTLLKYVMKKGSQELRDDYHRYKLRDVDDMNLMHFISTMSRGEIDPGFKDRFQFAWNNTPMPYKKALLSSTIFFAFIAGTIAYSWYQTVQAKRFINRKRRRVSPGFGDFVWAAFTQDDPYNQKTGNATSPLDLPRDKYVKYITASELGRNSLNYLSDMAFAGLPQMLDNPTPLYNMVDKGWKTVKDIAAYGYLLSGKYYSPEDKYKMHNATYQDGKLPFVPEGTPNLLLHGAENVPYGFGNLYSEYLKWYAKYGGYAEDWGKMRTRRFKVNAINEAVNAMNNGQGDEGLDNVPSDDGGGGEDGGSSNDNIPND